MASECVKGRLDANWSKMSNKIIFMDTFFSIDSEQKGYVNDWVRIFCVKEKKRTVMGFILVGLLLNPQMLGCECQAFY